MESQPEAPVESLANAAGSIAAMLADGDDDKPESPKPEETENNIDNKANEGENAEATPELAENPEIENNTVEELETSPKTDEIIESKAQSLVDAEDDTKKEEEEKLENPENTEEVEKQIIDDKLEDKDDEQEKVIDTEEETHDEETKMDEENNEPDKGDNFEENLENPKEDGQEEQNIEENTECNEQEDQNTEENNENDEQKQNNETKDEEEVQDEKESDRYNELNFVPKLDPEEIDYHFDNLIRHQTLPPEEYKQAILDKINRKRLEALELSEYDEVRKYDLATQNIHAANGDNIVDIKDEERKKDIDRRANEIKNQLHEAKIRWNSKIERVKQDNETRLQQMKDRHHVEIKNFKSKWQDPNHLRQFNKPSTILMNMRATEKKFALAKKYDDARATKRQADRLQQQEEDQMQIRIQEQMQIEFLKLKQNQLMEIQKLTIYHQKVESELETQKEKELEPYEHAIETMDLKKNQPINKKFLIMQNRAYTAITSREARQRGSVPTPRTSKQLLIYRTAKAADLNIVPLDDSVFDKLERMKHPRTHHGSRLPKL